MSATDTVASGEYLSVISRMHGVRVDDPAAWDDTTDPSALVPTMA